FIEQQSLHFPVLHKLDETYALLDRIGERGDLSKAETHAKYLDYLKQFKELEEAILQTDSDVDAGWLVQKEKVIEGCNSKLSLIAKNSHKLGAAWAELAYADVPKKFRPSTEEEWKEIVQFYYSVEPLFQQSLSHEEVIEFIVKTCESLCKTQRKIELYSASDSELEQLYDAIKEFDPKLKRENLSSEEKKEVVHRVARRGRQLVLGGIQTHTLPYDPISLRHHVKELKVNDLLRRADKHLNRVNWFHKGGVKLLAVSVLLIVESIFIAYPAVSIGITAAVIAIEASDTIFQNYFVDLDRKKLALKMERHSYRHLVDPEISNVPGHPEALQKLKRVMEERGLDSAHGTKASLQVGRTTPDYEKRTRRMAKWIQLKSLRQRVNRALYRDISRADDVKSDTYSKELKQVHARLVQQLKQYSDSVIWSLPDSVEAVSQLYADQQRLQREREGLEAKNKKLGTPLASKLENAETLKPIDEELFKLGEKIGVVELIQSLDYVKVCQILAESEAEEILTLTPKEIDKVKSAADPAKKHLDDFSKSDAFEEWERKHDEYEGLIGEARKIEAEQDKIFHSYQGAVFGHLMQLKKFEKGHRPHFDARVNYFNAQIIHALKCAQLTKEREVDYSDEKLLRLSSRYDSASKLYNKKMKKLTRAGKRVALVYKLKKIILINGASKKEAAEHRIGRGFAEGQQALLRKLSSLSKELLQEYGKLQRVLKEEVQQPLTDHHKIIMNIAAEASKKLSELEKKVPTEKNVKPLPEKLEKFHDKVDRLDFYVDELSELLKEKSPAIGKMREVDVRLRQLKALDCKEFRALRLCKSELRWPLQGYVSDVTKKLKKALLKRKPLPAGYELSGGLMEVLRRRPDTAPIDEKWEIELSKTVKKDFLEKHPLLKELLNN
ncbi:MAG: hypothetical protein K1000chlam2_01792, partial [Chlamydiae bacterium]|nr:hypothetical protein [Chlamydiota bacterium]